MLATCVHRLRGCLVGLSTVRMSRRAKARPGGEPAVMVIRLSPDCRELIEHQCGVIARWQATACAVTTSGIDDLLRNGRWQYLYRGVYAAHTGAPSRQGIWWAAVLRCGPDAALSHFTAAELDGIAGRRTDAIHVTVPHSARIRISERELRAGLPRICLHRSARIGMARHPARTPPRTRVAETVLDLIELAPDLDAVFSWLSAACGGRHATPGQIRSAMVNRAKMRWRADVLAALAEVADGAHSNLEWRYVRHVERPHGLPKAVRQFQVTSGSGSEYLDNRYAAFKVVVELDGAAWHPAERRWKDIHRDNFAARSGNITLRYSWADITVRPCQVAMEIGLVLRQRGWTGTLRACGPACQAVRS